MNQNDRLTGILDGLQRKLAGELDSARSALTHPSARGGASEHGWLKVLRDHLPHRYRADKAMVIDAHGAASEQIDIVIYDRQYSPLLYNDQGQHYVPAESVYAVFEVKQKLNRDSVHYAAGKAASVRRLHRTSFVIHHAGGEYKPRPPHRIVAGVLAYASGWKKDPFGPPLQRALEGLDANQQLDIGCAFTDGVFEAHYGAGQTVALTVVPSSRSLVEFFFRLLRQLQALATAPAIDYGAYLDAFANRRDGATAS